MKLRENLTSIVSDGGKASALSHHEASVNGTELHYVTAGTSGTPILLVHGFPESWWAFREVIPLLAQEHRVIAVDLRGFGDSATADENHDSTTAAEDLHQLVGHLDLGPVHLVAQDIAGGSAFRLATGHPEDVLSFTGIEMGLAGFGLEGFADVTHGGSWHIGVLADLAIANLLLPGRERELLGAWAYPSMTAVADAITDADVDEFARTYARPGGWNGAAGLYRSMLAEGEEFRRVAAATPIEVPVLAIGAAGGPFTAATLTQVTSHDIVTAQLDGVGHFAAQEAPRDVAAALLGFITSADEPGSTDRRSQ
jgi:pimeloyl-ACP methyl ester carboxylesterase